MADMHPGTAALLRYFRYEHLPQRLQVVSAPFGDLAQHLAAEIPGGPELTTALRKLLESKDCAVRAAVDAGPEPVVAELAHDRVAQMLHVNVRIPDGLTPQQLGVNVAREVTELLAQRSAAEQSGRS